MPHNNVMHFSKAPIMLMIQRVPESPFKKQYPWEFLGDPVVRTRCFYCQGLGSLLGQDPKSHGAWPKKILKRNIREPPKKLTSRKFCI